MCIGHEYQNDFPILKRHINGKKLVYLDNAATSQKPQAVIDSLVDFYSNHNANVHRGIHTLSEEATQMYEEARVKIQKLINARYPEEIIFTKGTTESLNMVAQTWGKQFLNKGDEIAYSILEHHSNLVPWQILAKEKEASINALDIDESGFIKDLILNPKTKLLAISHASNTLGTVQPLKEIVKKAHQAGVLVVVDGAQAVPHMKVDVQSLDADFYAFSGHKMLGPTGIGVLYVKKEILKTLNPYQTGGGMIKEVFAKDTTYAEVPSKFEAGTPNVADAIALGVAVDYMNKVGIENIRDHEKMLSGYAFEKLSAIEGLRIYGPQDTEQRVGLIAFTIDGIHPHDLASVLDTEGVAVRSGHHCTMPLHKKLNLIATTRASFHMYNTKDDINVLVEGINKAKSILLKS